MTLEKQLQEATDRLRMASLRIGEVGTKPATQEVMQEWLVALTDYVVALGEVHDLNMEALQERVEDLVQRQRRAVATEA
jgi:hypothetical protein